MIIPEIATTVNSDPDTPINDLLYIMDYKQYGESSGVYQNKDALQKALMTWYAVNDIRLRKEAVQSANSNGQVGELLAKQYGVNLPQLKQYTTLDAIKHSTDKAIMDEFYLTDGKFRWLFDSNILGDEFYVGESAKIYFDLNDQNVVPAVATAFYKDFHESIPLSYDGALAVYNKGSLWWSPFNNQTWLASLYSALEEQHTIVEQTDMSSNLVTGILAVVMLNAKRWLGGEGHTVINRIYDKNDVVIGSIQTDTTTYTSVVTNYSFIPTDSARQDITPKSGSGWYPSGFYRYI